MSGNELKCTHERGEKLSIYEGTTSSGRAVKMYRCLIEMMLDIEWSDVVKQYPQMDGETHRRLSEETRARVYNADYWENYPQVPEDFTKLLEAAHKE